jgi:hypothetical protein
VNGAPRQPWGALEFRLSEAEILEIEQRAANENVMERI